MKTVTFTSGLHSVTLEVPRGASRPLWRYLKRHWNMPFLVSGSIFLRHWKMGVNLMDMPDPKTRAIDAN